MGHAQPLCARQGAGLPTRVWWMLLYKCSGGSFCSKKTPATTALSDAQSSRTCLADRIARNTCAGAPVPDMPVTRFRPRAVPIGGWPKRKARIICFKTRDRENVEFGAW
eukprot:5081735-Lingulodinium_polyedra.AAC.1